jgi:hypothetical protein
MDLVRSLSAPPDADEEAQADEIDGLVSGLLSMVGITADPLSSREHILLSNLVQRAWTAGEDLDLGRLVHQVQDPPNRKLGVLDLESFYPAADRTALALQLNGLLASPSFAAWSQVVPIDIGSMLSTGDGRAACSVIYLAHLSEEERQFVVTLVLSKLVTWMRGQSGTRTSGRSSTWTRSSATCPRRPRRRPRSPSSPSSSRPGPSASAWCCPPRTRSTSTTRRSRTPAPG